MDTLQNVIVWNASDQSAIEKALLLGNSIPLSDNYQSVAINHTCSHWIIYRVRKDFLLWILSLNIFLLIQTLVFPLLFLTTSFMLTL